jgi:hypothetical protein
MNWSLILILAAIGVILSALIVFGILPATIWLSLGFVLIAAVVIGHQVSHKIFLHGFLTAVIWSVIGGALQFIFWDKFMANNPQVQAKMAQVPEGMDIRPWMAGGMVVGAVAYGAILGGLAMLFAKLLGEEKKEVPTESENQDQTPVS